MTPCEIHVGSPLELADLLPEQSVDALMTDASAVADGVGDLIEVLRVCHRTLKPGAHALVAAPPRASHRAGWAAEVAGFEVRDVITHLTDEGGAELWTLARKRLDGSVAENVVEHGVGALNIRATRVPWEDGPPEIGTPGWGGPNKALSAAPGADDAVTVPRLGPDPGGRWPANVTLDPRAAALLDAQAGPRWNGGNTGRAVTAGGSSLFGNGSAQPADGVVRAHGWVVASRFFHVTAQDEEPAVGVRRWLCRLVAPAGASLLDPFASKGDTAVAAALEGLRFIGVVPDAHCDPRIHERVTRARRTLLDKPVAADEGGSPVELVQARLL